MNKLNYYILSFFGYVLSLLPLCVLYLISDVLCFIMRYVIRYRHRVIHTNLTRSFPEKNAEEIARIEKQFYAWLCDYFVETLKLCSISREKMRKCMTFEGVDDIVSDMRQTGKNFCFVYLGHYGNWEWIASLPYWVPEDVLCGQIYHPLRSKASDRFFLKIRSQFGGECIAMKETLRRIIELKREKRKAIIGFISDQSPKWNSIHHWTEFLHQDTPVFIGTEKIGKQTDALIYFANVTRPKRGHYHCKFERMCTEPKKVPDYELTDRFSQLLEEMIKRNPQYWLWSHKRWKRTKEEWLQRQQQENKK